MWQAIAAQREAAYGNPAGAWQPAAEALKPVPKSLCRGPMIRNRNQESVEGCRTFKC